RVLKRRDLPAEVGLCAHGGSWETCGWAGIATAPDNSVIVSHETICKVQRNMSSEPAGHAQPELERFLPYRLSVLSSRLSSAIARLSAERFSLGMTEWRVMAVLGRYPDLSASEVTGRTAMDKVAVSRAVARLIDAEWLQRRPHAHDRRRPGLRLSEAG